MMQRIRVLTLGMALLAVATSVPLEAANKEHQQMMADLRILQQQTQLLQAHLTALTEALKTVTTQLNEQAGANRKAFADQKLLVDGVATDLRVVREKVAETNVRLGSISQEVDAVRVAQAANQAALTAAPAGDPGAAAQDPTTPPAKPPSLGNPGVSPKILFESARTDYYTNRWSLAIGGFEYYLKTFPNSDLADDAQYYIGESYYGNTQFRDAVAAYDRVIANYPTSNTLPDVYYKRGLALNSLGQIPQARESWATVVKNYPDSDAGRLAKQALDRLPQVKK